MKSSVMTIGGSDAGDIDLGKARKGCKHGRTKAGTCRKKPKSRKGGVRKRRLCVSVLGSRHRR